MLVIKRFIAKIRRNVEGHDSLEVLGNSRFMKYKSRLQDMIFIYSFKITRPLKVFIYTNV